VERTRAEVDGRLLDTLYSEVCLARLAGSIASNFLQGVYFFGFIFEQFCLRTLRKSQQHYVYVN